MANERFSSQLIDEGTTRIGAVGSLRGTLLAGLVLTAAGVALVWCAFFLLASVS
jgi:hypothetical protein